MTRGNSNWRRPKPPIPQPCIQLRLRVRAGEQDQCQRTRSPPAIIRPQRIRSSIAKAAASTPAASRVRSRRARG